MSDAINKEGKPLKINCCIGRFICMGDKDSCTYFKPHLNNKRCKFEVDSNCYNLEAIKEEFINLKSRLSI